MVCPPTTSEAEVRWPRFGLVVVATYSPCDNKDQMIRPYGSMRLSELDQKSQGPCKVQVQVNNALRLALGVKKMDHISVEELLDRTNSLSYNQLVIQATQRLTSSIIKGDCKGLKGFFECDLESKRTTRSSEKGDLLPPTMKNIPSQGFRHQSVKLWNSKGLIIWSK
jgi:hypothetical protein